MTSSKNRVVNCIWNDWKTGKCSKTCGGGTRTNSRTKKRKENYGGICQGKATFKEECNKKKCPSKKQT